MQLRIWRIKSNKVFCERELLAHKGSIVMRMELSWNFDRAVTRDINGSIFVWDLRRACIPVSIRNKQNKTKEGMEGIFDEDCGERYLLRKITSISKSITCIAVDDRQLLMGSIGHFNVFDYWNSFHGTSQATIE